MSRTVFLSWQADTPTSVGRNFLRDVLEKLCRDIKKDVDLEEAIRDLEPDSDTADVPGQPPIFDTVLKKIDNAAVFLADLTFTGQREDGRPTPNPNVLIEYGWALKALGWERIIWVMNTAYGEPTREDLPFDLGHLRQPIKYLLPKTATTDEKKEQKRSLSKKLREAILASLSAIPTEPESPPAPFPAVQAKDGPARFRAADQAVGYYDDFHGEAYKVFLAQGPAIWLRLMPLSDTGRQWTSMELKNHAREGNQPFLIPLNSGPIGYSYVRANDGFGMYWATHQTRGSTSVETASVAFAFNTGEVWGIDTYHLSADPTNLYTLTPVFSEALVGYGRFLSALGIGPPYRWIAGFAGVQERHLIYPLPPRRAFVRPGGLCDADTVESTGQYDGQTNGDAALFPLLKDLFSHCGMEVPEHLRPKN